MIDHYQTVSTGIDSRITVKATEEKTVRLTNGNFMASGVVMLFLMLTLLLCQGVIAQITIPAANTATSLVRNPLGSYFGYERTSMIYTAAEIGTTGTIGSVGFFLTSKTSAGNATNVRIYMKMTASATHTAGTYNAAITGATLVYGPVTITAAGLTAGAWNTITLATPFAYTGTNLQILVETNATGAGSDPATTSKQFRCGPAVTGAFESWAQDTTDPSASLAGTVAATRPNVQLTMAVPCTGTPAPGNTISSVPYACTVAGTAVLSLQNATSGSGVSYQWQSGPTSTGAWTNVGTSTNSYTASLTTPTWYRCSVTCSGNTGTSTPVLVGTAPCYTVVSPSNTTDEELTNVTVGTLNNTSNCTVIAPGPGSILNRYSNFTTTVSPPTLQLSSTVSYSFTQATCGSNFASIFQIYIDYNRDGLYTTANEKVYTETTGVSGNRTITGTFVVPAGATVGTTGMRVVIVEGGTSATNYATTAYSYGETEDYLVNIAAASAVVPDCAAALIPATSSTNISRNPTLSWTAGGNGPTSYDVYFGTSSTPPLVSTSQVGLTYTPATALAANTLYYWKVVPKNAIGSAVGCSTISFTTGTSVTYCTPTYVNGPGTVDIISNVTLGTINNTTVGAATPYYTYYNALSIPNIGQGNTATVSVTMGNDTTQYAGAWIDFNQNGIFEASEGVVSGNAGALTAVSLVFTVPVGAVLGNTRMRVRGGDDVAMTTSQACGATNDPYGETEDYIVNITVAMPATQCATLTSPANGATNVNTVLLTWTAPATGPVATSYDVYISTAASPAYLLNTATTSVNITGFASNTLYYWKVIPKSATGTDATGCTIRSFTTGNPFAPYCSAVTYTTAIEPITLVNFAGINRSSSAVVGGTPALENYIADVANVTSANSYNITLKGNTDGATFTTYFAVYIDWNQDGLLTGANERYVAGSVTGSTGVDAISAVTAIAVPEAALAGNTRMRVTKLYSVANTDPCVGGGFGQSEDYTVNVTACTPTTWYADADSDTFGNPSVTQSKCIQPAGYVSNSGDCNDANAAMHLSYSFYADTDGDTYGAGSLVSACAVNASTAPAGYSLNNTDCDPTGASNYRLATLYIDLDADGYNNGTQPTCYGATVPGGLSTTTGGSDCNDANAAVHVLASFYVDSDGDTFGTGNLVSVCAANASTPPAGYSLNNTDCNDNAAQAWHLETWYVDTDHDGYNVGSQLTCMGNYLPPMYSLTTTANGDCDDNNAAVHVSGSFYVDNDGDTYGTGNAITLCVANASIAPAGYSLNNTDCYDDANWVWHLETWYFDTDHDGYNVGSQPTCMGDYLPPMYSLTTIANGDCDDNNAAVHNSFPFYADADGDTYGAGALVSVCAVNALTPPAGYSLNNTDCNDDVAGAWHVVTWYFDADADGYNVGSQPTCVGNDPPPSIYSLTTLGNGDCDDNNAAVHVSGLFYVDNDGDTYGTGNAINLCVANASIAPAGYSLNNTDCYDDANWVWRLETWYFDTDHDGYNVGNQVTCMGDYLPPMYSLTTIANGDCDDNDAAVHNSFPFYADADGDTYGAGALVSVCAVNATTPPAGYSLNNTDCNDEANWAWQIVTWYFDADADGYNVGSQPTCVGSGPPPSIYSLTTIANGDCDDNNPVVHASFPFYVDNDGDTYGTGNAVSVCAVNSTTPPAGYSLNNTDCYDDANWVWHLETWYFDTDHDGYNVGSQPTCMGDYLPPMYSLTTIAAGDCDDNNAAVHNSFPFYADADGDTYGAGALVSVCAVNALTPPAGYSLNNTDCNDEAGWAWHVGTWYLDIDADGYNAGAYPVCYGNDVNSMYSLTTNGTDCDDNDPTVYQTATLYTDSDGDGYDVGNQTACYGATVPSGYSLTTLGTDCNDEASWAWHVETWYFDTDQDGYNVGSQPTCMGNDPLPSIYSLTTLGNGDCNDNNPAVHNSYPFYADADGDSYGVGELVSVCAVNALTPPAGYSLNNTDCYDNANWAWQVVTWYFDADGDGYNVGNQPTCVGSDPPPSIYSLTTLGSDCDDNNAAVHQTAILYTDNDGDGYNAGSATICYGASVPAGYSLTTIGVDCNDNSAAAYQSATIFIDADGDGYYGVTQTICYGATLPAGSNLSPGLGFDCNDSNAAAYPGHIEIAYNLIDDDCDGLIDEGFPPKVTVVQPGQCGITIAQIDSYVYCQNVPNAQGYNWRITTLTGTTAGQVQYASTYLRYMRLTSLANYAFHTQYQIEVSVQYAGFPQPYVANACTVWTPETLTQLTNCGASLTNMTDVVYANIVPFATGYKFRVTNILDPLNTMEIVRNIREFRMNLMPTAQYNATYSVEVAVRNTDGTYLAYGPPCNLATPTFPTTQVQESQCELAAIPTMSTLIYADSYAGAQGYRFKLYNTSLGYTQEVDRVLRNFTLNNFTGLVAGQTYTVKVALQLNGIWGPYGKACAVIVPGAARVNETYAPEVISEVFKAVAYPNPFANSFKLELSGASEDRVEVKVYDMIGKLVEVRQVNAADLDAQEVGERYPSGVYNIVVTQGGNVKTLRVIKR